MSKIAVIARITAQDGKRDELVDALQPMMEHVETEQGTEVYALATDAGDENVVWFYELYTDQEALGVHSSSEAMANFGSALSGLVAGPPELNVLNPVAAKGLDL